MYYIFWTTCFVQCGLLKWGHKLYTLYSFADFSKFPTHSNWIQTRTGLIRCKLRPIFKDKTVSYLCSHQLSNEYWKIIKLNIYRVRQQYWHPSPQNMSFWVIFVGWKFLMWGVSILLTHPILNRKTVRLHFRPYF